MRKNRFLARLSSGAFVVAFAAGGVLLIDGVAGATSPASVRQVMATSTQTTLSTSASSVYQGELVTLTATITPAVAGTVQFKDGMANLGDQVPVSSTGTATAPLSTSTLTLGTHWLTAVFTPIPPSAHTSSTSTAVFLDSKAPPTGTTTTRQVTILIQATGSMDLLSLFTVRLAAKLTTAANGQLIVNRMIEFYGGGQLLCQAVTDATGLAQCSGAQNLGPQTGKEVLAGYVAVFPGDGEYGPSTQHTPATIGTAPPKP